MADRMQKQLSQDSQPRVISNRGDKAEFSKRCFMLAELISMDIPDEALDSVLASMWQQSVAVIGIQ